MADHLDDRRGRPDDRLGRARGGEDEEQGQGGHRLGPVDARDVGAGEDRAGRSAAPPGRSRPGWRNGRAAPIAARSTWAWAAASGASTYWKAWRTIKRHGRDLAGDLEQAGGDRAARAGQHQVDAPPAARRSARGGRDWTGAGRGPRRPGRGPAGSAAARAAAASDRNSGRADGRRARRSAPASRGAPPISPRRRRRARRSRARRGCGAICSQKMRRRISGPKARRARAAEVATSTKVHKGKAQTNKATALRQVGRVLGRGREEMRRSSRR